MGCECVLQVDYDKAHRGAIAAALHGVRGALQYSLSPDHLLVLPDMALFVPGQPFTLIAFPIASLQDVQALFFASILCCIWLLFRRWAGEALLGGGNTIIKLQANPVRKCDSKCNVERA